MISTRNIKSCKILVFVVNQDYDFFHARVLFCVIMSDDNKEKIKGVKTDVKCHEIL